MITLTSIPLAVAGHIAFALLAPVFVFVLWRLWIFGGRIADKIDRRRWPRD